MRQVILKSALPALLFLTAACGSRSEGDQSGAAEALPAGLTLYPGAEVSGNARFEHGGVEAAMITMRTPDDPAEVIAFYRRQVEDAGLAVTQQAQSAHTSTIAATRDRGWNANISATRDGQGTTIGLIVGGE